MHFVYGFCYGNARAAVQEYIGSDIQEDLFWDIDRSSLFISYRHLGEFGLVRRQHVVQNKG